MGEISMVARELRTHRADVAKALCLMGIVGTQEDSGIFVDKLAELSYIV